ncbi:MAG: nitrilase family protein [Bacteroidales bacterium]|nr:nitrilase family protein [Bacteroidales bacterium]
MTLALFQQPICWEDPAANFRMVEQQLASLTSPVDIILLPETFSTGFSDNMARMADAPEGVTLDFARRMAARHDALFVATWTVRDANGAVYNRLHWVRPDGTYGCYDKAHTFRMSSEASQLVAGRLAVCFEWRGWRIRPAVCYDLRFPVWLRNRYDAAADRLDYDLLLVCANWPASRHQAWSTLLRARAIENQCYVAGVNRVGDDGVGIHYAGYSAAVDFKGEDRVVCQPDAPDFQCVTLDKEALQTFRSHWPFYLDGDGFSIAN